MEIGGLMYVDNSGSRWWIRNSWLSCNGTTRRIRSIYGCRRHRRIQECLKLYSGFNYQWYHHAQYGRYRALRKNKVEYKHFSYSDNPADGKRNSWRPLGRAGSGCQLLHTETVWYPSSSNPHRATDQIPRSCQREIHEESSACVRWETRRRNSACNVRWRYADTKDY